MKFPADGPRPAIFVLVLLCATVVAQAPSFALEQGHAHSATHCCARCHTGPVAFLHSPIRAGGIPTLPVGWLPSGEDFGAASDLRVSGSTSRAPPA